MSVISDWESRVCFVWAVERPLGGRPRTSPNFKVNNVQLCLRLSLDSSKRYSLELPRNPYHRYSFYWTVHVEDKKGIVYPLISSRVVVNDDNYCIWSYPESEILKAIPDFLRYGLLFFQISVKHSSPRYEFNIEIPKVEASVQTDSLDKGETSTQTRLTGSTEFLDSLSCLKNLSDDLSRLLEGGDSSSNPDVALTCGDQTYAAHRLVLSNRSEVFAATLRTDMVEGRTGRIEIRDMEPETFSPFLRYLYTGMLSDLTAGTARLLYEAGDRYAVAGLMRRCGLFLQENMAPENACQTLVLADNHRDQELKEIAMAYVLETKVPAMDDLWPSFAETHTKLAFEVLNRFYKSQSNK